ncbi:hypothetical protein MPPM_1378 [Methylorubrum populi]|uniref:Uncharacterized protein n=1 Tax=Methylorubrum populi TaxID=223967 RepID=A0A160PD74_9HYPH|nr:hypothetical protein [Methylorubrum populi]BAU89983.1 hypothetical protein MPPM_1378 [Methylorubrum populi]
MTEPWTSAALARVEQTTQLASEIRTIVEHTKLIIASSREILAAHGTPHPSTRPLPARSPRPPDALCAAFDALLEAARQAEKAGDPDLFILIERALLQAGDCMERTASTLARREPPVQ